MNRMSVGLLFASLTLFSVGCGGNKDKIIRVSRQNNSGTYVYFREAVLGKDGDYKLGSIDQSGSKDVVELVSKTPQSIGYSGMGYATDEVKMLPVSRDGGAPVAPTPENAKNGDYPLARPLNIYVVGKLSEGLKHYLDWIMSDEGQKIVTEIGYVPAPGAGGPPPADDPPEGSIKIAGSDTMVNLAQAWAETYSIKYPQVRPEVAGGGSGVGIAKLIDGTVELANASRDMKEGEGKEVEEKRGSQPTVYIVALDALAVYVHKENPLDSISIADLAEIYGDGGTIVNWPQVKGWPAE